MDSQETGEEGNFEAGLEEDLDTDLGAHRTSRGQGDRCARMEADLEARLARDPSAGHQILRSGRLEEIL